MKILIIFIAGLLMMHTQYATAQQDKHSLQEQIKVRVDGLACPFCAYGLEKKLKKLEGVEDIKINLDEGLVTIHIKEGITIPEEIIRKRVGEAGFTPKEIIYEKHTRS